MTNSDNSNFLVDLNNKIESDEDFVDKLKSANLYLTLCSEEYPGRIERLYPDGSVELCPIGMTLMEARVQQREDAQKAGLSGII
tara:strand:+ start:248 stop:499 length:252 start_codon:yes stop_codon:yes gene_type:complete